MDTEENSHKKILSATSGNVVDIVDEYVDRERRKCNLLVHNLPESEGNDIKVFSGLVNKEFGIASPNITKAIQLGKTNPEKPQPLLVTFRDISSKRNILKHATKLQNSSSWSKVFISPDLTPKEREVNKRLREELKNHKDAGEKKFNNQAR